MDRSTAAIDEAWKRGDALAVEAALKAYAEPGHIVQSLIVENTRDVTVTLCLEPHAEEMPLAPQASAWIFVCGPVPVTHGDRLHIQHGEDSITVWGWGGGLAYMVPKLPNQPPTPPPELKGRGAKGRHASNHHTLPGT